MKRTPITRIFWTTYQRVDTCVSRLLDTLGGISRVIVLSDHGFTRLKTQVYLNNILKGLGYLSFKRPAPQSPEDIDPSSLAFAMVSQSHISQ